MADLRAAAMHELGKVFRLRKLPTKYCAGYETKSGRQLALNLQKRSGPLIYVWVEDYTGQIRGVAVRNVKYASEPYAPDQGRAASLRSNAPRLAEGNTAWYLTVESLDALKDLIRWYSTI